MLQVLGSLTEHNFIIQFPVLFPCKNLPGKRVIQRGTANNQRFSSEVHVVAVTSNTIRIIIDSN